MPAFLLPALLAGGSALAGLFGNRGNKSTQDSKQVQDVDLWDTTNSSGSSTGTSMPTYDPMQLAIRDYLLGQFGNKLTESKDMFGYTGAGLRNINAGADLKEMAIKNVLASRGLSFSPASATPLAGIQSQRIGDQVNFLNSVPLLQRQLQMEDLDRFAGFFKSLPVGTTTNQNFSSTGTSHKTGQTTTTGNMTQTNPGNMVGGALSGGLAGLLAGFGINKAQYGKPWGV